MICDALANSCLCNEVQPGQIDDFKPSALDNRNNVFFIYENAVCAVPARHVNSAIRNFRHAQEVLDVIEKCSEAGVGRHSESSEV